MKRDPGRPTKHALWHALWRNICVSCLIGSALSLVGCAASQSESRSPPVNPANTETPDEQVQATLTMQDGSSFERAVAIDASTEREGGAIEYRWVADKYPGYRVQKQSLMKHDGRQYDVLQILDAAGEEHVIYFDITAFFGKR